MNPEIIAAVGAWAAVASAIVIAVQSFYTRKSVKVTEEALKVARDEFTQTNQVVRDAQRSRIDAEMPMLTIIVEQQSTWVFDADLSRAGMQDMYLVPGEDQFRLPDDADRNMAVDLRMRVINDGPRSTSVRIWKPFSSDDEYDPKMLDWFLPAGESRIINLTRTHSLRDWIDYSLIYELGGDGRDGSHSDVPVLEMFYTYPGDTGATEAHRVIQSGSVFVPVAGNDRLWTPASLEGYPPRLIATVEPFVRTYWASRKDERPV